VSIKLPSPLYCHVQRAGKLSLSILATLLFICNANTHAQVPVLAGTSKLGLKAQLGQQLFFDSNLSTPPGQACASCHDPSRAFVDPDGSQATSHGASPELKGSRNAPMLSYAAFSPAFGFNRVEGLYTGGLFLDGRAATLADQAKGPFLNPIEMANPDVASVISKVRLADYASLFKKVYGAKVLDNNSKAFNAVADAISSFERSPVFKRFDSKYDYVLAGKVKFTEQEKRGHKLFENPGKGNCAACHPSRPAKDGTPPLFTDFSYDNLGVPKNPENPFYEMAAEFNSEGQAFVDQGLGKVLNDPAEMGKFKVPSLRNIAKTAPYTHNGYFKTLKGVVQFYSTRDTVPVCKNQFVTEADALKNHCWPVPEEKMNVNYTELGEMVLSATEVDDLVAFLKTLTDGYKIKP